MPPTHRALLLVAALAATVSTPAAFAAQPDPSLRLLGTRFTAPTTVGAPTRLEVRATDPGRPVSGVVVSFAGEGLFGLSACRSSSSGRVPTKGPFAPGSRARFVIPHVFKTAGARAMSVRADTGGCNGGGTAVLQPSTVTPTPAGEPIVPFLPGIAALLPVGVTAPLEGLLPPAVAQPAPLPVVPGVTARAARAAGFCVGEAVIPVAANLTRVRAATLCLINFERTKRGLAALRNETRLRTESVAFARTIVRTGVFEHVSPSGRTLTDRLRSARYVTKRQSWRIGENLGTGTLEMSTPRALIGAWMASPAHRVNILDKGFKEIGIGVRPGMPGQSAKAGATYATAFGKHG